MISLWSALLRIGRWIMIVGVLVSSACAYFESWDHANAGAIGDPIRNIVLIWGPPDHKWQREDGFTIYEYHLKKLDPSCFHYWVVNPQGTIVDFYYKGYCRPIG